MDTAYLADLYFKFNDMDKQLQSNELNLIKTKALISAFLSKLICLNATSPAENFANFRRSPKWSKYCQMLHEDFLRRFDDVLSLGIPNWVLDLFIVSPQNVDI
ncbi:hypothetical protein D918_02376 [Trichuris suis]|nr:hypothetical protein D918_02376 [Trichuris suis]